MTKGQIFVVTIFHFLRPKLFLILLFGYKSQKLKGSITSIKKLTGSAEPVKPVLKTPLVHINYYVKNRSLCYTTVSLEWVPWVPWNPQIFRNCIFILYCVLYLHRFRKNMLLLSMWNPQI